MRYLEIFVNLSLLVITVDYAFLSLEYKINNFVSF